VPNLPVDPALFPALCEVPASRPEVNIPFPLAFAAPLRACIDFEKDLVGERHGTVVNPGEMIRQPSGAFVTPRHARRLTAVVASLSNASEAGDEKGVDFPAGRAIIEAQQVIPLGPEKDPRRRNP
jgi:hypothetical protein